MGCKMYQNRTVKLFPGFAYPSIPKQPKESLARVEESGKIREELLGQRTPVNFLEPKAPPKGSYQMVL